jgi:hypothetical protein
LEPRRLQVAQGFGVGGLETDMMPLHRDGGSDSRVLVSRERYPST